MMCTSKHFLRQKDAVAKTMGKRNMWRTLSRLPTPFRTLKEIQYTTPMTECRKITITSINALSRASTAGNVDILRDSDTLLCDSTEPLQLLDQGIERNEHANNKRVICGLNLGYTCDNLQVKRSRKVYTSRNCIRKTFEEKGLKHVSGLALANTLDLLELLTWNYHNNIHLYRMTSKLFPWAGHYAIEDLPDFGTICSALGAAGELARATGQRITNHPSCYIKLASTTESITESSIKELEIQSQIFDLMGYAPSHWNKINIHVGGVYGNKEKTMEKFAETFHARLSTSLQSRLTIENDDSPNSYSVDDLLVLHEMTGIPVTFDFHHHQFCPGAMSKKEAFLAAISTWPEDVRPVVHWSEMPECPQRRRTHPHSHSNFVYGPIDVYGYETQVDIMIESKAKEAALLLYRDTLHEKYMH